MELFGIGPMELLFILVLALVVLGPKDMVKTGQSLGRFLRNLVRSPAWKSMMNTSREIRELPTRLVRESGLQEEVAEINRMRSDLDLSNLPRRLIEESGISEAQQDLNQLKSETQVDLGETISFDPSSTEKSDNLPEQSETN
jgi:sec-independent protein translocase protein TatB